MKTIKKSLKWFSIILIIGVFYLLYLFFFSKVPDEHLKLLPVKAESWAVINSAEIFSDLKSMIASDPSLVLDLETNNLFSTDKSLGLHPMAPIGLFKDNFKNNAIYGAVLFLKDEEELINFLALKSTGSLSINQQPATFYLSENKKIALVNQKKSAVIIYTNSREIDSQFCEDFLSDKTASKEEFFDIKQQKAHFINENKIAIDSIPVLNGLSAVSNNVELVTDGLKFKSTIALKDAAYFKQNNTDTIYLGNQEFAKISLSVSKDQCQPLLNYLPKEISLIKNHITGKIWASIIGFRKKDLFLNDSILLNENFSIPELAIGFEVNDITSLISNLEKDSSFINQGDYFELNSNNFKSDPIFLIAKDNQIIVCSRLVNAQELSLNFSTLSAKIDLEKSIANYPVKQLLQMMVVNSIKSYSLKSMTFSCIKKEGNLLYIEGDFKLGNEDENILRTILPALELVSGSTAF